MTASIAYKDLIEEAFIEPIRSVMVIDDEYPTLTNLISVIQNREQNSYKVENLDRLQNIISMCHGEMKCTVDVFDGKDSIESHIPDRLKHSDLVILDYHLDGDVNPIDSEKARDILHSLDRNQHFNIVMVHTNGLQDDIEKVYDEILCDFIKVTKKHLFELNNDLDDIVEDWLVENDPNEDRFLFLKRKFGIKDVVKLINIDNEKEAYYPQKPTNFFHPFKADIQQLTDAIKVDHENIHIKDITQWFGSKIVLKLVKELKGTREISEVKWGWENEVNYICTDNIFITGQSKT
ncbi:response regulator receiver domain [Acinetobacter baumannii]|uniref:response regulator receiver domain n=1 Tax=Acinetobacter baumannii TaxID=470 RepID=UPI000A57B47B|nr:response regulator receiver domain [Acinetobacter baumannii]